MGKKTPENIFRDNDLRPQLNKLTNCWYFIKEAVGLRGIPDIIGCINGKFFALEVKKCKKDANRNTGRIVMQKYICKKINDIGGFARFVYPENCVEVLNELETYGRKK